MIPTSVPWRIAALSVAVALHAGVVAGVFTQDRTEMEASEGQFQASLGSGFADMVAGSLTAPPIEDITESHEPDVTQAEPVDMRTDAPDPVERTQTPQADVAQPPEPTETETSKPQIAEAHRAHQTAEAPQADTPSAEPVQTQARTATLHSAETSPAELDASVSVAAGARAVVPLTTRQATQRAMQPVSVLSQVAPTPQRPVTAALPVPQSSQAAQVPHALKATVVPEPMPAASEPNVVVAEEEGERETAVDRSLRPPVRKIARAPAPVPEPAPRRQQPTARARGNAQTNQVIGAATGARDVPAAVSGVANARGTQQGNAAASNYPGQVRRRIDRVPRPRVGVRGQSVVAFRIAAGGGLASVSIAISSGSAKLDAAAMRAIQRAAPFPVPPEGARRDFTIRIVGR